MDTFDCEDGYFQPVVNHKIPTDCNICFETGVGSVKFVCNHGMCLDCYSTFKKSDKIDNRRCPFCREKVCKAFPLPRFFTRKKCMEEEMDEIVDRTWNFTHRKKYRIKNLTPLVEKW